MKVKFIIKLALCAFGLANSPVTIAVHGDELAETYLTESSLTMQEMRVKLRVIPEGDEINKAAATAKIIGRNPCDERYLLGPMPESEAEVLSVRVLRLPPDPVQILYHKGKEVHAKYQDMHLGLVSPFAFKYDFDEINFAKLQSAGCLISGLRSWKFWRDDTECRLPFCPEVITILKREQSNVTLWIKSHRELARERVWEQLDEAGIEVIPV